MKACSYPIVWILAAIDCRSHSSSTKFDKGKWKFPRHVENGKKNSSIHIMHRQYHASPTCVRPSWCIVIRWPSHLSNSCCVIILILILTSNVLLELVAAAVILPPQAKDFPSMNAGYALAMANPGKLYSIDGHEGDLMPEEDLTYSIESMEAKTCDADDEVCATWNWPKPLECAFIGGCGCGCSSKEKPCKTTCGYSGVGGYKSRPCCVYYAYCWFPSSFLFFCCFCCIKRLML